MVELKVGRIYLNRSGEQVCIVDSEPGDGSRVFLTVDGGRYFGNGLPSRIGAFSNLSDEDFDNKSLVSEAKKILNPTTSPKENHSNPLKLRSGEVYTNADGQDVCIEKCVLAAVGFGQDKLMVYAGRVDNYSPTAPYLYYTETGHGINAFVGDRGFSVTPPADLLTLSKNNEEKTWLTGAEACELLEKAGYRTFSISSGIGYSIPDKPTSLGMISIHPDGVIAWQVSQLVKSFVPVGKR